MISLQVNDGVTEAAIPFTPYLKDNETRYSVPEKGRRSTRIPDLYWPKEIVTNNLDEDETEKKDLVKALRPGFETLGFHYFKDSILGSSGLFGKKVAKDLYFLAALIISRLYDDKFTVDLSLRTSTSVYYHFGDIPFECEFRPSKLLSTEERLRYFQVDDHDYWWSLYGETDIHQSFFEVLSIAERRIIRNIDIQNKIRGSITLYSLAMIEKWVIDLFNQKSFEANLLFTPMKPIDDIPIEWFLASETLMLTIFDVSNKNMVYSLASRAYIRSVLDFFFLG